MHSFHFPYFYHHGVGEPIWKFFDFIAECFGLLGSQFLSFLIYGFKHRIVGGDFNVNSWHVFCRPQERIEVMFKKKEVVLDFGGEIFYNAYASFGEAIVETNGSGEAFPRVQIKSLHAFGETFSAIPSSNCFNFRWRGEVHTFGVDRWDAFIFRSYGLPSTASKGVCWSIIANLIMWWASLALTTNRIEPTGWIVAPPKLTNVVVPGAIPELGIPCSWTFRKKGCRWNIWYRQVYSTCEPRRPPVGWRVHSCAVYQNPKSLAPRTHFFPQEMSLDLISLTLWTSSYGFYPGHRDHIVLMFLVRNQVAYPVFWNRILWAIAPSAFVLRFIHLCSSLRAGSVEVRVLCMADPFLCFWILYQILSNMFFRFPSP